MPVLQVQFPYLNRLHEDFLLSHRHRHDLSVRSEHHLLASFSGRSSVPWIAVRTLSALAEKRHLSLKILLFFGTFIYDFELLRKVALSFIENSLSLSFQAFYSEKSYC